MPSTEFIPAEHAEIRRLYDAGKTLAALRLGEEGLGPLLTWRGVDARLIGARIAMNLGAPRISQFLQASAYRNGRRKPEAILTYSRLLAGRRGPVSAIEFVRKNKSNIDRGTLAQRAEALANEANLLASLRDFDAAHVLQSQAEALDPGRPWLLVERASILIAEDRYDEALAAVQEALTHFPYYRPAVQAATHLLSLCERDDEALQLLAEANQRNDSFLLAHPLVEQLTQAKRFDEAEAALRRLIEVTPLQKLEPYTYDSAASLGAMIAAGRGDRAATIAYLRRENAGPISRRMAARLDSAPVGARRVELAVPFVRQHHVTCAPATLTAISRFWNRPANHLDIVEKICYNGTAAYSERRWVEDNGWTVREFTLDWDAAVVLLDRGVPFTLTTRATGMGHLQAVAGYDPARKTLLIRDPYYRHLREAMMPDLVQQQRAGGPRALALVPTESAPLLDGLTLPDSPAYDQTYALQDALERHDRAAAWAVYEALAAADGMADHRMTIEARATIAAYDGDRSEQLACVERLVAMFPEDGNYQLMRLALLRDLAPRDRRLEALEALCAPLLARAHSTHAAVETEIDDVDVDDANTADTANPRASSDPIYLRQLAGELSADARQHARTLALLGRARRFNPIDPVGLTLEAQVLWEQRRFAEALLRYRWSYTLTDQSERHAFSYFQAARAQGKAEEALNLFRGRFERHGRRSSDPAQTLFQALHQVDRTAEAFEILDKALALRPEDAELALFAAERNAEYGRFDQAHRLLDGARTRVTATEALSVAANIARREGNQADALTLWHQVVAVEPLRMEAHSEIARLLVEAEGEDGLNRHFAAITSRFPQHFGLHRIWADSLDNVADAGESRRRVLDILNALNPADAWTRRESALEFCARRKFLEAFDEIQIAYRIEPTESAVYSIRGHICASSARFDEARASFRAAISLSADNGHAINELLRLCDTPTQQREALQFVEEALTSQTVAGSGVLAYRELAARYLPPEETVRTLHRLLTRRPDLWQGWSAIIAQLTESRRLDDALNYATHAIARFPLRSQLYLDAAAVHEGRDDAVLERAALDQALKLDPHDGNAVRALCASYERTGELIKARDVLYRAATREPLDAGNRFHYARLLHRTGSHDLALNELKVAARLRPQVMALWAAMLEWNGALGRSVDDIVDLAREALARRPGEARLHFVLAFVLPDATATRQERVKLLDRAIHLNSRLFDAYELRAQLLARSGDLAAAIASCRPPGGGRVPSTLQLLAARVESTWGRGPKAGIAKLTNLMAAEPEFFEGWLQIADWHRESGPLSASAYKIAAEKLTQLRPQEPRCWGYYGQALQWSNDIPSAIAAYQKATEIDATYFFAASTLLGLLLKANRLAEARTVVDRLDRTRSSWAHVYAIQMHLRGQNSAEAVERVCRLCESMDDDVAECIGAVQDQLLGADGVPAMIAQRLGERVRANAKLNPVAGGIFIKAGLATGNRQLCDNWVAYLQSQGEIGVHATEALLTFASQAGEKATVQALLRDRSAYLRESDQGWGAMAMALLRIGDPGGVVSWTVDWRQRTKILSHHLLLRAAALRELGRRPEAVGVAQHALTLRDTAGAHDRHRIWLAIESAVAGRTDISVTFLDGVSEEPALNDTYRFLYLLAKAMTRMVDTTPIQRGAAFGAAKEFVIQAKAAYPMARHNTVLSAVYGQAIRRIAADAGGPTAQSWLLMAGRL